MNSEEIIEINESPGDYFKETIETLERIKQDLQPGGRLRETEGKSREKIQLVIQKFRELILAFDYYKDEVDIPKTPEQLKRELQKREIEESKAKPLGLDQYIQALWLEKKGLSVAQIARFQNINERMFRASYVASKQKQGKTQAIIDKVQKTPDGEQDYALGARSSDPYSKPRLIFLEIYRVKPLLREGLKPKAIAQKLSLNFDSFKSWLKANKKYLDI